MKNTKLSHVAFIMDGNGRWATERNKKRTFGHFNGVKVIPNIIKTAIENDIEYISFFAFSIENWNRPKEEVNFLFKLALKYLSKKNLEKIKKHGIRFKWIGLEENIPQKMINNIKFFEKETELNPKICVNIFFNYSGVKDINNAINIIIKNNINEVTNIKKYLLTKDLPEIDLLIRTGGEERISNFALYDLAYSEIIFEKTLWPNYTKDIFINNLKNYYERNRRFGEIKSEKKSRNKN